MTASELKKGHELFSLMQTEGGQQKLLRWLQDNGSDLFRAAEDGVEAQALEMAQRLAQEAQDRLVV